MTNLAAQAGNLSFTSDESSFESTTDESSIEDSTPTTRSDFDPELALSEGFRV